MVCSDKVGASFLDNTGLCYYLKILQYLDNISSQMKCRWLKLEVKEQMLMFLSWRSQCEMFLAT